MRGSVGGKKRDMFFGAALALEVSPAEGLGRRWRGTTGMRPRFLGWWLAEAGQHARPAGETPLSIPMPRRPSWVSASSMKKRGHRRRCFEKRVRIRSEFALGLFPHKGCAGFLGWTMGMCRFRRIGSAPGRFCLSPLGPVIGNPNPGITSVWPALRSCTTIPANTSMTRLHARATSSSVKVVLRNSTSPPACASIRAFFRSKRWVSVQGVGVSATSARILSIWTRERPPKA